jgi:predicted lipoprotein with Yx(FWY)xxD motif
MKRSLSFGIFALALAGFAAAVVAAEPSDKRIAEDYVHVPIPPGIQVIASHLEGPVFADARGRTLYIWPLTSLRVGFAGDGKNTTVCTDQITTKTAGLMSPYPPGLELPDLGKRKSCAQEWPPAFAPDDAKPDGSWTTITRPDGKKQWAYHEQAVYTSDLDHEPGDVNGATMTNPPGGDKPAYREPIGPPAAVPPGFTMLTTHRGRMVITTNGFSIYTSDKDGASKANCYGACADTWTPVLAPAAVKTQGDWTLAKRSPGVKQWAFRGKPVYTYALDTKQDSLRGSDVPGWHNVYTQLTPPAPQGFTFQDSDSGVVLADSKGKTIYLYNCADDSLDQLACDHPDAPQQYRLAICGGGDVERCLKTYPYVMASPEAKAIGHLWTVVSIDPKTGHYAKTGDTNALRVWAYRGRPVFTYAHDVEPGDINGHDHGEFTGKRNGFQAFWIRDEFFGSRE